LDGSNRSKALAKEAYTYISDTCTYSRASASYVLKSVLTSKFVESKYGTALAAEKAMGPIEKYGTALAAEKAMGPIEVENQIINTLNLKEVIYEVLKKEIPK
jgi:hypothetical protein